MVDPVLLLLMLILDDCCAARAKKSTAKATNHGHGVATDSTSSTCGGVSHPNTPSCHSILC
jgi:hypothetical protein